VFFARFELFNSQVNTRSRFGSFVLFLELNEVIGIEKKINREVVELFT
jgi:hypothetical protein